MSAADSPSPQPSPAQGRGGRRVEVIGAGLAGCEAALQCARRGVSVRLHEMRPERMTEAHETGDVAELVCSNSLKSDESQNAHGLLKAELRVFGSALLECAERARIPGGKALVVDRRRFSAEVQKALDAAGVEVMHGEVVEVPASSLKPQASSQKPSDCGLGRDASSVRRDALYVIATGPLTSQPMAESLQALLGTERLFFYDAIAPIVAAESLDLSRVFEGSRYGAGDAEKSDVRCEMSDVRSEDVRKQTVSGYLNCPMSEEEYARFVDALLGAQLHPLHDFEKTEPGSESEATKARKHETAGTEPGCRPAISARVPLFEGCLPVEEIARRGRLALAFGPMKPVGLVNPRTGKRPFAVVQLRRENAEGTMYNLVGFQTRLTYPEQERVFRLIPGLEQTKFLRLGSIHRNTYLDAPRVLLPTLQTRARADLLVAGQLAGVEGYVESIGAGLVAGINAARLAKGVQPPQLPAETMLGSLLQYITGGSENLGQSPAAMTRPQSGTVPVFRFQPMNANFGLLPPLAERLRGRDKRRAMAERALASAREFALTVANNRA